LFWIITEPSKQVVKVYILDMTMSKQLTLIIIIITKEWKQQQQQKTSNDGLLPITPSFYKQMSSCTLPEKFCLPKKHVYGSGRSLMNIIKEWDRG